jgi:hypothetical protein
MDRTRSLLMNVVIAIHVVMLLIWVVLDRTSLQLWAEHPVFRVRFADALGLSFGTDITVLAFGASVIGLLSGFEWGWWIAVAINVCVLVASPLALGGLFIWRATAYSLFAWMSAVALVLIFRKPVRRFYVGSISKRFSALSPLKSWLSSNSPDRVLLLLIASLTILQSLFVLMFMLSPYLSSPGITCYGIVGVVIGGALYRRSTTACIAAVFWHAIMAAFVVLFCADKWFLLPYNYLSEVGTLSLLSVFYLTARTGASSRLRPASKTNS